MNNTSWSSATLVDRLYNDSPCISLMVEAGAEIQNLRAKLSGCQKSLVPTPVSLYGVLPPHHVEHPLLVHTEEKDGFTIHFEVFPYAGWITDQDYIDSTDLEIIQAGLVNGDFLHFTSKVSAHLAGIELGRDYLWSCVYKSHEEFMQSIYYAQMVISVVEHAKKRCR